MPVPWHWNRPYSRRKALERRGDVVTKEEYRERTRVRLEEMEAQIEELMAQATRSDYDEYLTDIRAKQESAQARLAALEEASGEGWQELRTQLDKAVSDVQNALFVITSDSEWLDNVARYVEKA
jgi:chromosome segregation ATPase